MLFCIDVLLYLNKKNKKRRCIVLSTENHPKNKFLSIFKVLIVVAIAVVTTILLIWFLLPPHSSQSYSTYFGEFKFNLGKFTLENRGQVVFCEITKPIYPVSLVIKAHDSPAILNISAEEISLSKLVDTKKAQEAYKNLGKDFYKALNEFIRYCINIILLIAVSWGLLFGFFWGFLSIVIAIFKNVSLANISKEDFLRYVLVKLSSRIIASLCICLFSGGLFAGLMAFWTYKTIEKNPYKDYRIVGNFENVAKAEPQIKKFVSEFNIEKFSKDLKGYSENLAGIASSLYEFSEEVKDGNGHSIRKHKEVLFVSDIHLNPLAMDRIVEKSNSKEIDLVIIAGDLTIKGTPLEADIIKGETDIIKGLKGIKKPVLIVGGNHDSVEVMQKLKDIPNFIFLDGVDSYKSRINKPLDITTLYNLRISGVNDPFVDENSILNMDSNEYNTEYKRIIEEAALDLEERYRKTKNPKIDIFVVHYEKQAEGLVGKAPVILSGHTHKSGVTKINDTWIFNAGTIGMAPPYNIVNKKSNKLTYQVLYFDKRQVISYDEYSITLRDSDIYKADYGMHHISLE